VFGWLCTVHSSSNFWRCRALRFVEENGRGPTLCRLHITRPCCKRSLNCRTVKDKVLALLTPVSSQFWSSYSDAKAAVQSTGPRETTRVRTECLLSRWWNCWAADVFLSDFHTAVRGGRSIGLNIIVRICDLISDDHDIVKKLKSGPPDIIL
jgi:hypothetical protein